MLACLKEESSGIEMLKELAQRSSVTAAASASGCISPAVGPLFSPTNTAAMLLGARLVLLHAAVLGCAGWFLTAASVVLTEPYRACSTPGVGLRGTEIFTKSLSHKGILNLAEQFSLILIFRSSWSDMGSEVLAFLLTLWLLSSSPGN